MSQLFDKLTSVLQARKSTTTIIIVIVSSPLADAFVSLCMASAYEPFVEQLKKTPCP
jgi:hypothetical protein